ncbi:hypothetical protein CONCODRAFT_84220 [Conidiobolus coronatus NRRL 28638]|uniref:Uncharacterized protein n=1 Tax=Conidiobolus coronatus (strain ATCC 28846 / CBS 209.66 / NRRL 28638) TaxID=796925 RepID=A0A137PAY7_CONC2|nr:hypothetical protein CONCODRAFT_84220 [Conidiobolus coronatus NRRL 28638]|eukprot:KXN72188.1 hypothetical protein CONCODRAFT_84220 [Conidiobolus coronatus NRRL 28638]
MSSIYSFKSNSNINNSSINDDDTNSLSLTDLNRLSDHFSSAGNSPNASVYSADLENLPTIIYTPPTLRIPPTSSEYLEIPSPTGTASLKLPSVPTSPRDSQSSEGSISLFQSDSDKSGFSTPTEKYRSKSKAAMVADEIDTFEEKPGESGPYTRLKRKIRRNYSIIYRRWNNCFYSNKTLLLFPPDSSIRQFSKN